MGTGPVAVKSLAVPPAMSTITSGSAPTRAPDRRQIPAAPPTVRVEPRVQCLRKIEGNLPMGTRAARHYDDASPIKLVVLLAALDPAEKCGFVHPQRQLNIHRRLICGRYSRKNAGLQPGLGKSGTGDSVTPGFHSTQSGPRLVTIQERSLGRVAGALNRLRQTSLQVVGHAANFRFAGKLTRRRWSPIISASTSINSTRRGDRRKQ